MLYEHCPKELRRMTNGSETEKNTTSSKYNYPHMDGAASEIKLVLQA